MKKWFLLVVSTFIIASLFFLPTVTGAASEVEKSKKLLNEAIATKNWGNSAVYSTRVAEYYDKRGQYQQAVPYYEDAAKYWGMYGEPSWGVQYITRANQIRTEVTLYVEKPTNMRKQLAKFEPVSGTYLGLWPDGVKDQVNPDLTKENYGKNHAIYLTYTHWGMTYPGTNHSYFRLGLAEQAKRNGAAIQVALEPLGGLDQVVDGEYIRKFAREAKASGVPVFLRFAGEMNGNWVPWHGDPEKYKEKFRLIHDIMEQEAPNVAMVWSPNFFPYDNLEPYYPGDQYVDWVGVSLYAFPYTSGKENLGSEPISSLKPIYEKYSHKPMMISEGAVGHYSYANNKDYTEWAKGQMGNFYGYLPRMFPQLKAITYYNSDKDWSNPNDVIENNYDIGKNQTIESTYKRLIQNPYLIDQLTLSSKNDVVQTEFAPYESFKYLNDSRNAFVYVKLPLGKHPYYVAVYQGDKKLGESYTQPWDMKIDFSRVDRNQPLTLMAFDDKFQVLASERVNIHTTGTFKDVPLNHYSEDAINDLAGKGIINGVGNGRFGMGQPLTRWQAVLLLARANNLSLEHRPNPGFVDVSPSYPYYKEIAAAVDEGIFQGVNEKQFDPNATLTRAQMAVVLQRLYEFPEPSIQHPFTDLSQAWYYDAVARLFNAGITSGVTATRFGPNEKVTREQFAVFMYRAMER